MKSKRRRVRMRRLWREWVRPVVPIVLVLLCVRSAVADWNDVPTGSMKPTILEGDRIFVNKLAYDLKVPFTGWSLWSIGDPQRGEVIVFFSPDKNIRMVKRVIGTPGDTVELRRNLLYVNGDPVERRPLGLDGFHGLEPTDAMDGEAFTETLGGHDHAIMLTPAHPLARTSFRPLKLGANQYFVMGDNRDNSSDSRVFGLVPRRLIAGRATRIVMSVDPSAWTFRWDRLLRPLP
jgi:signal peptidase I